MKTILVINNDFDTMSLIKKWLEKKGYKVKFTGNHREALRLMKDFKPSLAIIDILQHAVAVNIKANPEFENFPILLMTGILLLTRLKSFLRMTRLKSHLICHYLKEK